MKKYTSEELNDILKNHNDWLNNEGGKCGDFSFSDLESANLESSNLDSANLSYANLSYANLRSANLSSANLDSANLSSANLESANLDSANLSSAVLDKRYIVISCIGSRKDSTTYCFDDDIIFCGCFKGTLEEFENKVINNYKNNERYLREYIGAINYIKMIKQ